MGSSSLVFMREVEEEYVELSVVYNICQFFRILIDVKNI